MKRKTLRWIARGILVAIMTAIVLLLLVGKFSADVGPETQIPEPKQKVTELVQKKVDAVAVQENSKPKLVYLNMTVLEPPEEDPVETAVVEEPAVEDETPEMVGIGTYTITAYCPCEICCGWYATTRPLDENGEPIVYTESGALAEAGTTIAVDTSILPHGTTVWFEGPDGSMEDYIAQDTGSKVGGHHIDLYFEDHEAACSWGLQYREVFVEVPDNG